MDLSHLLTAIFGGLTVIFGQSLTHYNTLLREEKTMLRSKSEVFIKALFDDKQELEKKHSYLIFKDEKYIDVVMPINEAFMIQRIYFPELASDFNRILESRQSVSIFIDDQYKRMLEETRDGDESIKIRKTVWQTNYNNPPHFCIDEYIKLTGEHLKNIDEFIQIINLSIQKRIKAISITNIALNKFKNIKLK